MYRALKHAAIVSVVVAITGIAAGGCLDRPVVYSEPNLNTTFVTRLQRQTIDKVDLLFMIDNSASMGDKQTILNLAVPLLLRRLVQPNCIDPTNNGVVGTAKPDGTCPTGSKYEFPPVHDLHVGIVSSSLGSRGGNVCPDATVNPANTSLSAHMNDNGELINRAGTPTDPTVEMGMPDETTPNNFLAYFPNVPANDGKMAPPDAITDPTRLAQDFQAAVSGVHEHGCGFEAQEESWYRFLVQPDPYGSIVKNGNAAAYQGVDETILQQRAAFLRPDSLLAVIVVTDETQETADPVAVNAQGWDFENSPFACKICGQNSAPEGTTACGQLDPSSPSTTGPNSESCTSCAFASMDANFSSECPADPPTGTGGDLDPSNDELNVRFFHQKERFGIYAGFPMSRYIRGLQRTSVPDRTHEHDGSGNYVGDQDGQANCVNPIYAQNLPTKATDELCKLQPGPRSGQQDLVYYAAITGVPHQLLQSKPGDSETATGAGDGCPVGTPAAQCPQKLNLNAADWKLILGNDPEHYDFSGSDFHMIESEQDRTSSTTDPSSPAWANHSSCPDGAADNCDPFNGREWPTNKKDLQWACTFPLIHVDATNTIQSFQKDCTSGLYKSACDCQSGAINSNTQLCAKDTSGNYTTTQINGKAYPCIDELIVAKAMSNWQIDGETHNQGIVSSLCPIQEDIGRSLTTAQEDPLFGYNPAANAIIDRLKTSLANTCVPQKLLPDSTGRAPCLILVSMPPGTQGTCKNPGSVCNSPGLVGPGVVEPGQTAPLLSQDVLDKYCDSIQSNTPVCAMTQLILDKDDSTDCSSSSTPGWCYVQGAAAQKLGCPYTIEFTGTMPPSGATTNLQCLEHSTNVVGDGG
ncbi:MAG TPA: hypothetical protein VF765_12515 [Polyangiaceae bacterium]